MGEEATTLAPWGVVNPFPPRPWGKLAGSPRDEDNDTVSEVVADASQAFFDYIVPDDFATVGAAIQAGLAASKTGILIGVRPGTYTEVAQSIIPASTTTISIISLRGTGATVGPVILTGSAIWTGSTTTTRYYFQGIQTNLTLTSGNAVVLRDVGAASGSSISIDLASTTGFDIYASNSSLNILGVTLLTGAQFSQIFCMDCAVNFGGTSQFVICNDAVLVGGSCSSSSGVTLAADAGRWRFYGVSFTGSGNTLTLTKQPNATTQKVANFTFHGCANTSTSTITIRWDGDGSDRLRISDWSPLGNDGLQSGGTGQTPGPKIIYSGGQLYISNSEIMSIDRVVAGSTVSRAVIHGCVLGDSSGTTVQRLIGSATSEVIFMGNISRTTQANWTFDGQAVIVADNIFAAD